MLDDEKPGFRWGRAIMGGFGGLFLAFCFVKAGNTNLWWLLAPACALASGWQWDAPAWWFWGDSSDSDRDREA